MEQTLPPLVSDEQIRDTFMYGSLIKDPEHGFMSGANYVRHEYEQDRAKTREVVQALVDALDRLSKEMDCDDWGEIDVNGDITRPLAHDIIAMPGGCPKCKTDEVIDLAKSQLNIEPTK